MTYNLYRTSRAGLGEPGVSPEQTAMKAVSELVSSLDAGACVDEWYATLVP
jgi:RNA 3'-terminal phosphate cyclase